MAIEKKCELFQVFFVTLISLMFFCRRPTHLPCAQSIVGYSCKPVMTKRCMTGCMHLTLSLLAPSGTQNKARKCLIQMYHYKYIIIFNIFLPQVQTLQKKSSTDEALRGQRQQSPTNKDCPCKQSPPFLCLVQSLMLVTLLPSCVYLHLPYIALSTCVQKAHNPVCLPGPGCSIH